MPFKCCKHMPPRSGTFTLLTAMSMLLLTWVAPSHRYMKTNRCCPAPTSRCCGDLRKRNNKSLFRAGSLRQRLFGCIREPGRCSASACDVPASVKFEIYITTDPFMNAHAYPDGGIFITTGLLARLENEAQLAAILAHEMAHALGRDALRAYRQCSGAGGGDWLTDRRGNWSGSRSERSEPSEELSECLKGVGRRREPAADACGLDMLVQAQYDPSEALRVFYHQKEALSSTVLPPGRPLDLTFSGRAHESARAIAGR